MPDLLRNKRVWVAGETGMVGRALLRRLEYYHCTILSAPHGVLDLRDQQETADWMRGNRPDIVIVAAGTVGGIESNRLRPAEFLYDNLMIAANVIHAAAAVKAEKLLYLGSSCIYPKEAAQPIGEDALLSGPLEQTNEAYAVAKIAGVKLCQSYRRQYGCDFISAMPCNLYGPGDTYDPVHAHVIPALIQKIHAAKEWQMPDVTLWGTGRPLREFLHVDDLAAGLITLLNNYSGEAPVNLGSGQETSIAALAGMVAANLGYGGRIIFDETGPDGTPRKILDSDKIRALGWSPKISLEDGLRQVITLFLREQQETGRAA